VVCSVAWNGPGSCAAGSNSDLSIFDVDGSASAAGAGIGAGLVRQVLAPAEGPDSFKCALNLGRTCWTRSRGRLCSPQCCEISTAVAVAHENSPRVDLPPPCSPSPHDGADGSAAADGPVCMEVGVASAWGATV
jgi:hypothetical protein